MARLVRTSAALEQLARELAGAREIALDTEFHLERTCHPELMLIQLRGDQGEAALVDPRAGFDLGPLASVLVEPRVVVHGGLVDVQILARTLGIRVGVVFDTQIAAGLVGLGYPARLQDLVRACLRVDLPKSATLSDWSARPLTEEQLRYAADDVLILGSLRRHLATEVQARGHEALLAACVDELLLTGTTEVRVDEAWRSLAGAQGLDGPERATLKVLAAWREGEARRRDVPRHSLASDAILLDIARRRPRSVAELRLNRRMPSHLWKREAEAVLGCVAVAEGTEPPPRLHGWSRGWAEIVRAAARCVEASSGIAAELLLSEQAWSSLAAGRLPADWRGAVLGEGFLDFLAGRQGLYMPESLRNFTSDPQVLAPS